MLNRPENSRSSVIFLDDCISQIVSMVRTDTSRRAGKTTRAWKSQCSWPGALISSFLLSHQQSTVVSKQGGARGWYPL